MLEVGLVSLKAAGRGSLVLRGLSVLCSFPEEVGLVFPPFCYSGLATSQTSKTFNGSLDMSTPIHV